MRRGARLGLTAMLLSAGLAGQEVADLADNSFLIEEAYNQEPGVVQHIVLFSRVPGAWSAGFTQEWPFLSRRHQLSYTLPLEHAAGTGLGDVQLHYRYQLAATEDGRLAVAPRATLILPTGSTRKGRGSGGAGAQAALPVSVRTLPGVMLHLNAGATIIPAADAPGGGTARTTSYAIGASLVWLARKRFNLMLESVWADEAAAVARDRTVRDRRTVLSPGFRWGHDFTGGAQLVLGLGYAVVVDGGGEDELLLYASIEHPF